ncbi:MAG: endonuclease domain-containing protein [Janthinobacterium lividum]
MVEGRACELASRMSGAPVIVDTARRLRRDMSLPEVMLWQELRQRPGGQKFRRQHAIGDFILDFYCSSARLAIEVDGRSHDHADQPERDIVRDTWLATQGVRCIRIAAAAVMSDAPGAASWLAAQAASPFDRPSTIARAMVPLPEGGEDQGVCPARGEDQGSPTCR